LRKLLAVPLVLLAVFVFACGGDDDDDDGGGTPAANPTAAATSPATSPTQAPSGANPTPGGATGGGSPLEVTIADFSYDPAELTIEAGVESTIQVTNGGSFPHTFTIDDVTDSGRLDGGNQGFVSFTVDEPGEYEFYCTVHGADRMSGTLTVE
jgi:plastocyanin